MYGIGNFKGIDDIAHKNEEIIYQITSINGIKFNQIKLIPIALGIGLSLEKWNSDILFPVFVSTKFFVLRRDNSPYLFANVGYIMGKRDKNYFANEENGNLYLSYGLGYQFKASEKLSLYTNASILHQQMDATSIRARSPYNSYKENYQVLYNFFSISFGIEI